MGWLPAGRWGSRARTVLAPAGGPLRLLPLPGLFRGYCSPPQSCSPLVCSVSVCRMWLLLLPSLRFPPHFRSWGTSVASAFRLSTTAEWVSRPRDKILCVQSSCVLPRVPLVLHMGRYIGTGLVTVSDICSRIFPRTWAPVTLPPRGRDGRSTILLVPLLPLLPGVGSFLLHTGTFRSVGRCLTASLLICGGSLPSSCFLCFGPYFPWPRDWLLVHACFRVRVGFARRVWCGGLLAFVSACRA